MRLTLQSGVAPEVAGEAIAQEFRDGQLYVRVQGLPFVGYEGGQQNDYIHRAAAAIGPLSLSDGSPGSEVWRLDTATSPSTERIPYHTDNPAYTEPEQLVGFWNVTSSANGGENVLLPVNDLLELAAASPQNAALLDRLTATPVGFTYGNHRSMGPIVDSVTGTVRFDRRYVDQEYARLADEFVALVEGSLVVGRTIKMEDGDALFFDNRRLLHAREPYDNPNRLSFRTRITKIAAEAA